MSTNQNLAPLTDGKWHCDDTWAVAPAENVSIETVNTHNGAPTFKVMGLGSYKGGVDHEGISVKPGDHIVMSVWVKTEGTPSSATGMYAGVGMDVYGVKNGTWARIGAANAKNDMVVGAGYPNYIDPNIDDYGVQYGSDWTQVIWDFIVPQQYEADGNNYASDPTHNFAAGVMADITQLFPWIGPGWGTYACYFSDFQFYINPSTVNATNLAPIPDGWQTYDNIPAPNDVGTHIDNTVLFNGQTSLRIDAPCGGANTANEIDTMWNDQQGLWGAYIAPGVHVHFEGYIKTSANAGGRIGIDLYDKDWNYITGISTPNGVPNFNANGDQQWLPLADIIYVPVNSDWTFVSIDFDIPATAWGDGYGQYSVTQQGIPAHTIAWLQAVGNASTYNGPPNGSVWFSGLLITVGETTPTTPVYILDWDINPKSGTLPFTVTYQGYLSRSSSQLETDPIVNGETLQLQALPPSSSSWIDIGSSVVTQSYSGYTGYFQGQAALASPQIYPGNWQFRVHYAGNVTKGFFGFNFKVKFGKALSLNRVNALIL